MVRKPKVGIFALTSCAGCQFQVLNCSELVDIINNVDLTYFEMIKQFNEPGVDIAFVEGCVSQASEIKRVRDIREKAKYLVALGTCATYGGVPSVRDFTKGWEIEKILYAKDVYKGDETIKPLPIDEYVKVDYYMRGCPIDKGEFVRVVKSLLGGALPKQEKYAVCAECKLKGNQCLLRSYGEACMGPITNCGCGAVCPSHGVPCQGCRGPTEDSNVESLVQLLSKFHTKDEISRLFLKFAPKAKKYRKYLE
jgi:coenzyme F420-reducing hydrogenase gamma subunit